MTVKVYALARMTSESRGTVKGKWYPVLKIDHPKMNKEGLVTIIGEDGLLHRQTAYYFDKFEVR